FLDFLEALELREEKVPGRRGEVVLYNLGQFSQLISDFETIHFHSKPLDKYEAFASFLQYGAEGEYGWGMQKNAAANPDAVRIDPPPLSWTPPIARECARSDPWRSGSDECLPRSSRRMPCGA